MEKEVKKLHPFNVMDQMIAHRLAMEGFEIINVIPSNKYADKAHFIFCFDSNSKFKKRFKEIKDEVEAAALSEAENIAELRQELERLRSENAKIKAEICEKSAENSAENDEKTPENGIKMPQKCAKTSKSKVNSDMTDSADMKTVMDRLASLEALGNCILGNVSALSFYEHLHSRSKEE